MAANRWSFTVDQLANTPSRKCGIDGEKESNYRQQAASLIQDMGQRLQVYPLITGLSVNVLLIVMLLGVRINHAHASVLLRSIGLLKSYLPEMN